MNASLVHAGLKAGPWLAGVVALACAGSAAAAPIANRAWVSGHGVDQAGCGAPTAPCRSLQYTHDSVVAAGGEIDILDPAGYGAITITKALSIVNDGVGTAGVQATSGAAIAVSAGPADDVYLRGLNIDGVQAQAWNGVQLNSARSLTIVNCVARHFSNSAIQISPTTKTNTSVVDTLLENNLYGLTYQSAGSGKYDTLIMDRVLANDNGIGIQVLGTGSGGVVVSASNGHADGNATNGFYIIQGNTFSISAGFDNMHIDDNLQYGVFLSGALTADLNRSVVRANGEIGIESYQLSGGGVIYSFGNNLIRDSGGVDVHGTLTAATLR
jgi:hypothetical protein